MAVDGAIQQFPIEERFFKRGVEGNPAGLELLVWLLFGLEVVLLLGYASLKIIADRSMFGVSVIDVLLEHQSSLLISLLQQVEGCLSRYAHVFIIYNAIVHHNSD